MIRLIRIFFVFFGLSLLLYVWRESPPFPVPPPDALQSMEPADTETPLRRAYFTNYTREQIIDHYKAHFDRSIVLRLNYPPEDAQTLIRDQTRSYYLEELVHPLRESVYINGFIPQQEKDAIWIGGQSWEQKITIKYVPSSRLWRVVIVVLTTLILYILTIEWCREIGVYGRKK